MEYSGFLRNVQDLLTENNTSQKATRRTIHKPNNSFWSNGGKSSEFVRDQSRLYQFGKNDFGIFPGYELTAVKFWKRDIQIADGKLDASEIHPRRINAKEVMISQKKSEFIHLFCGWYNKLFKKRTRIPMTHSKVGNNRKE